MEDDESLVRIAPPSSFEEYVNSLFISYPKMKGTPEERFERIVELGLRYQAILIANKGIRSAIDDASPDNLDRQIRLLQTQKQWYEDETKLMEECGDPVPISKVILRHPDTGEELLVDLPSSRYSE